MRILSVLTLALPLLAFAAPATASPRPPQQRDQAVALRVTTNWIAIYPARLWIAVELPQPCRALPSGRRICPIAIRLLAWTDGVLAPWRCVAHEFSQPVSRVPAPAGGARAPGAQHSCTPTREITTDPDDGTRAMAAP